MALEATLATAARRISAELDRPYGVAVDGAGNLLVADTDNNRVRVVAATTGTFYGVAMTAGDIYTVAGNGPGWFQRERRRRPGHLGRARRPPSVVVDGAGNLLVADTATTVSGSWPRPPAPFMASP